jgi:SAM-dependent methyltransferase
MQRGVRKAWDVLEPAFSTVRSSSIALGMRNRQKMQNDARTCPLCESGTTTYFISAPDRFHGRQEEYDLFRCSTCSYVWLGTPPKPEEMGLHYDEDYHRDIAAAGEGSATHRWRSQRETISRAKTSGAILDIGCSSGGFLGTMKGGSWKLYGIEMEASTAEKARAITGAEVFVGDVLDAPFPAESFDVITCFDVLEHVYHPRQFLTKVFEWLKPGGIFYAMVPNIDSWEARVLGTYWYGLELPRHISHFSPRSLRYVMTSLGFQETKITTPPISHIDRSAGYIYSGALQKVGISSIPMAKVGRRNLPSRAIRKALRISVVALFEHVTSTAGASACVEAVFSKNGTDTGKRAVVAGDKA